MLATLLFQLCPAWSECLDQTLFKKDFCFTEDWFSAKTDRLLKVMASFRNQEGVRGLEVGPFEGMSTIWFLENVLPGKNSQLVAIDSYDSDCRECRQAYPRFLKNLKLSGNEEKVRLIKNRSQEALKHLKPNSFDWAFIDGDSTAKNRLLDAVLAWDLLKVGGMLIIDDYRRSSRLWLDQQPKYAIETFVTLYRNEFKLIEWENELVVKKLAVCEVAGFEKVKSLKFFNRSHCVRLGRFEIYVKGRRVFDRQSRKQFTLSKAENESLLELLKTRKHGEYFFDASAVAHSKLPSALKREIQLLYVKSETKKET